MQCLIRFFAFDTVERLQTIIFPVTFLSSQECIHMTNICALVLVCANKSGIYYSNLSWQASKYISFTTASRQCSKCNANLCANILTKPCHHKYHYVLLGITAWNAKQFHYFFGIGRYWLVFSSKTLQAGSETSSWYLLPLWQTFCEWNITVMSKEPYAICSENLDKQMAHQNFGDNILKIHKIHCFPLPS